MSAATSSRAWTRTSPPERVLIIATRRIGDVLLATPVIRSLKQAWAQAKIDILVFSGTEGFVTANRDVNRVLTVPERPSFFQHARLMLNLARKYDLALSLLAGDRPTLYAFVAGKRRAGLLLPTLKHRWKRSLLHAWVPLDETDVHTVRAHLAVLATVGVAPIAEITASSSPEDRQLAESLLAPLQGARYAVLHVYPKFRYKMWTEAGWAAIARWLADRGIRVVLTGGAAADELDYVARIAKEVPGALNVAGKLNLGGVAHVVSRAAVYIGPDTAITHAAAGLGVPTVALFGPSNPVKWGPWPAGHTAHTNPWRRTGTQALGHVRLVQGAGACVPCGFEGCERHIESSSDCLTGLRPDTVIDAIRSVLE
ncbi:MAG: glycosyltransferase family 9 protein [Burkholderiales bacterium]